MLNVLLADDEKVIIRGLTKLVDWNALGLTIIGEVYKGDELLKAIIERSPDIVISDISMPRMSGIEVLKQIQGLDKPPKVIFISAYKEFSYARDALSYGAVDYLIKPIDRKKLEQILIKTVNEISEASRQMIDNRRLQHYEVQSKRQWVADQLESIAEKGKLVRTPELAFELGADEPDIRFTAIAVYADRSPNSGSWIEGERKLIYFAVQNMMEEHTKTGVQGWSFPSSDILCMVLRHDKSLDVQELTAEMHENIGRLLKLRITMGIGCSGGLEQLPQSFREAKDGIGFNYFLGVNRRIFFANIPPAPIRKGIVREKLEKDLLKTLVLAEEAAYRRILNDWLGAARSLSWGNRHYAVNLCSSMLLKVLHELVPQDFDKDIEEKRIVRQLQACETFDEASGFIQGELESLRMALYKNGSKEALQIVQIKAYIADHYHEGINLETMAARFYMNPYYFSTFFKKRTGQNFKQYVTEIRMQRAQHMLLQTEAMLYEIADKVGYNNTRQFTETFKKHTGMLPSDYRQRLDSVDKS